MQRGLRGLLVDLAIMVGGSLLCIALWEWLG
jgi:hypothetical protein